MRGMLPLILLYQPVHCRIHHAKRLGMRCSQLAGAVQVNPIECGRHLVRGPELHISIGLDLSLPQDMDEDPVCAVNALEICAELCLYRLSTTWLVLVLMATTARTQVGSMVMRAIWLRVGVGVLISKTTLVCWSFPLFSSVFYSPPLGLLENWPCTSSTPPPRFK